MSRFISLNAPSDLDNEYYTVLCKRVHVEKFAISWSVFKVAIGILGVFFLLFPQLNLISVAPAFVITVVCGLLLLFGCVKIIWLLYFPEIIWQIILICILGFFTCYQFALGFFYSFCDEEALKSETIDSRATFVLEYIASGVGLLLLTVLSIYFTVAILRACQFTRFYANGKAATNSKIIAEFKKGQEV